PDHARKLRPTMPRPRERASPHRVICPMLIELAGSSVRIEACPSIAEDIAAAFPRHTRSPAPAQRTVIIRSDAGGLYTVDDAIEPPARELTRGDVMTFAMEAIIRALVWELRSSVALHAGAVCKNGSGSVSPGRSGAGKSSVTAWLVEQGFQYITDEIAVIDEAGRAFLGLTRAMVIKPGAAEAIADFSRFRNAQVGRGGCHEMFYPADAGSAATAMVRMQPCALMVFPEFSADADTEIGVLTSGQAVARLIDCNLNARNLRDGGFGALSRLARNVTAISLRYADFGDLKGALDALADIAIEKARTPAELRRLLAAVARTPTETPPAPAPAAPAVQVTAYDVPPATPRGEARKLTIGMATYDDYDGAYFSAQAIRLYHPEVRDDTEILIIDNHPDGRCSAALKRLDQKIPGCRYVPMQARCGTAVRDLVFSEASGAYVLCLDSHVLVQPGAIKRLLAYFEQDPLTNDLLQGPLLNDSQKKVMTHFHPEWRNGMYGYWATDERGVDPEAPPFEIPMQGLGLFACRKAAWRGFNPLFRGFGGEEGYIHEKFRQAGARSLCLPFLRWLH